MVDADDIVFVAVLSPVDWHSAARRDRCGYLVPEKKGQGKNVGMERQTKSYRFDLRAPVWSKAMFTTLSVTANLPMTRSV